MDASSFGYGCAVAGNANLVIREAGVRAGEFESSACGRSRSSALATGHVLVCSAAEWQAAQAHRSAAARVSSGPCGSWQAVQRMRVVRVSKHLLLVNRYG